MRALVAQWIERSPAKAEVVGSNPAKRAIFFLGSVAFAARAVICRIDASVVKVLWNSEMAHSFDTVDTITIVWERADHSDVAVLLVTDPSDPSAKFGEILVGTEKYQHIILPFVR